MIIEQEVRELEKENKKLKKEIEGWKHAYNDLLNRLKETIKGGDK